MPLTDEERAKYPPVEYGTGKVVAFRDYDAEIIALLTEIRDLLKSGAHMTKGERDD